MPKKVAILGLGWLGLPLAKSLFEKGMEIAGSTTSTEKLMGLLQSRFDVRIIKVKENTVEGNWKNFIKGTDVLIINIPPGRLNEIEEDYPRKIQQIATRCDKNLKVIFISSTSVYSADDKLVTEITPPVPTKKSGKAVLTAERVVQDYFNENATIIRMAGLYGANRHPGRFLKKNKLVPNPDGAVNLIQLEDCIELITAVIEKDFFGEIINGCSDHHPTRKDFYEKAAFALSIDPPSFDYSQPSIQKIIDNQKSKDKLGMVYRNPLTFLEE